MKTVGPLNNTMATIANTITDRFNDFGDSWVSWLGTHIWWTHLKRSRRFCGLWSFSIHNCASPSFARGVFVLGSLLLSSIPSLRFWRIFSTTFVGLALRPQSGWRYAILSSPSFSRILLMR